MRLVCRHHVFGRNTRQQVVGHDVGKPGKPSKAHGVQQFPLLGNFADVAVEGRDAVTRDHEQLPWPRIKRIPDLSGVQVLQPGQPQLLLIHFQTHFLGNAHRLGQPPDYEHTTKHYRKNNNQAIYSKKTKGPVALRPGLFQRSTLQCFRTCIKSYRVCPVGFTTTSITKGLLFARPAEPAGTWQLHRNAACTPSARAPAPWQSDASCRMCPIGVSAMVTPPEGYNRRTSANTTFMSNLFLKKQRNPYSTKNMSTAQLSLL